MSGSTELLVLRLALIAVIFVFVAVVAVSLRGGLSGAPARTSAAATRRWKLVVTRAGETGLAQGTEFRLAGTMLIGRDGRAGVMLPDASVSTRHAQIERVRDGWRVSDLGSTNGTTVNGRSVGANGVLVRGRESIAFGNVVLQVVVE